VPSSLHFEPAAKDAMSKNRRDRRSEASKSQTATDPFKIYMNAERFRIADDLLRQDHILQAFGSAIASPSMVLAAFASELYLKCLFVVETGRPPISTHELRKLFLQVSETARDEIDREWNAYNSMPHRTRLYEAIERAQGVSIPRDLRWSLRSGNDAFVALRYSHEPNRSTTFFLGDLPIMVRNAILRRRPEWSGIIHGPAKDITPLGSA
jgi:hypothetical protein